MKRAPDALALAVGRDQKAHQPCALFAAKSHGRLSRNKADHLLTLARHEVIRHFMLWVAVDLMAERLQRQRPLVAECPLPQAVH